LLWAFLPSTILNHLGITYYPSKYWAITIPTYLLVCLGAVVIFYAAINLIHTEPLNSFHTITDELALPLQEEHDPIREKDGIPHPSDIPITLVNELLYYNPRNWVIGTKMKKVVE